MSSAKEQTSPRGESQSQSQSQSQKKETLEGLPLESSPYVKYRDLEDYKRQAYGTEGHLPVEIKQGASGSTDAPTLTGAAVSDAKSILTNASGN
ncbi:uncharacterized protein LOC110418316 [Herrania umbratica]|uniref:Uncharacterized protein LOC110418316 n=1 Tax=Herrania umbratica TaxID=108875 RepID=A0A6J1AIM6_9ROSI|nr:uncharacterized protein LOC110418316 [Herrania umbratica]